MADPADGLGGFPVVLQWALAAAGFIGSIIAIVAGALGKAKAPPSDPAASTAGRGVEMFFDGPIGKALDRLDAIYRETRQMREDQQRQANERNQKLDEQINQARQTNTLLGDIKNRIGQVNGPRRRP